MSTAAIIVAAGRGRRAGEGMAKQWREVAGRTSVAWCLARFGAQRDIAPIVLVLNADDMPLAPGYRADPRILVVEGGESRSDSVRLGLLALGDSPPDKVLIHDVARPCVSEAVIRAVITALDSAEAAAPALPLSDALWRGGETVEATLDRTGLYRAQTPQGFRYAAILRAHLGYVGKAAADDVEIACASEMSVAIVAGDEDNLKITMPGDFDRAERILRGHMDIRTGNGFDVHAFEAGDHVTLCGVKIPHDRSLKGHSDADVAMHALSDAIYGALGLGDIGQWFPPADAQWKDAASEVFLAHAIGLARERGYHLTHADCTIICEYPKIGPHAPAMKSRLAGILTVSPDLISVKATTSERLGFTGRGEGIAALATATLVKA